MKSILKEKKRYILFKIFCDGDINEKEIAIELYKMLGLLYSRASPKIILEKDFGIIITNSKSLNDIERALSIITTVNNKLVHLLPIYVSSSIKKIRKKIKEIKISE